MTRVALSGGAYTARSLASSAQIVLNLVPETPPPGEDNPPQPHYLTPGLLRFAAGPTGPIRGLYYPGGGGNFLYAVFGTQVCTIEVDTGAVAVIGAINNEPTLVSMQGSGIVIVICDGTSNGWYINLTSHTVTHITDSAFMGATSIAFLDTFLLFNQPGTQLWYSSPSNYAGNSTPFDPLFVASKSTYVDIIMGLISVNQVIWIIGNQTTELWVDVGAADFPFQRVPEVLIMHGTVSTNSIATIDGSVFWLSDDTQGRNMVLQGQGYEAKRISTPAVEYEWSTYSVTGDANGMTYEQAGHSFYFLTFPTADKTWVYDLQTGLWHQRSSADGTGVQHRHRMNVCVSVKNIYAGDFSNNLVYILDQGTYTDNGTPIMRQRAFPHMLNDGNRVTYWRFMTDFSYVHDTNPSDLISLDWSDDRGNSYGTPLTVRMNNTVDGGAMTFWRLGTARDRIFRLTWSAPFEVMLQGAWVDAEACSS